MRLTLIPLALVLPLLSTPAFAYLGPGLGMGMVATSLGIVVAIGLGLFSVLWYPIKRLVRRLGRRGSAERRSDAAGDQGA